MKKYNVAIASLAYVPSVGGLVTYLKSLAGELSKNGHNVMIYCSNSSKRDLEETSVIDSVLVHRCDISSSNIVRKVLSPIYIVSEIRAQIKKLYADLCNSDVIIVRHVYYAYALTHFPSLLNKTIFLIPLVSAKLNMINSENDGLLKRIHSKIISAILYVIEKKSINAIKYIAVLSDSKRLEIESYYKINGRDVVVINPGVDTERFVPSVDGERFHFLKQNSIMEDTDKFIILTVCRLVEEKNVESLIMSLVGLEGVVLYIVGEGKLKEKLEQLASTLSVDVRFWGFRPDTEIFYKISDAFVLPSTYEGFGHVFLEALACGCPVIGVRNNPPYIITASDEIIIEGKNGFLANSGDSSDIRAAIYKLKNFGELPSMKFFARTYTTERYSWKAHFRKIMSLIENDNK